ncbi:Lactosylceramide 1,3-N-acetyl-beta-D-glucosaminyltransferase [Lunasporangiospora selenospora]|uniref:Lactosylceramide 1,3-N-acetyl-beta-D-glucosaminyltransferase n=1 Tax=Lunasporangiospora selenospora TaxID=979761 RepID=A0A9P6G411_9FUNG|nr:Lactosylceramide 1,3-N-acetyl-beta-D-glucosaminyltransferase [Lunasporangiospora selenospora]
MTLLRLSAGAPAFLGLLYSLSVAWENKLDQPPYQNLPDDLALTRSDFWVASIPPNVVLRVALAHLVSWTLIAIFVQSRPVTEPTRPWVLITFIQALLLLLTVYLPWLKTQLQALGLSPKISEKLSHHALEDGFMGREINGHSATRFLIVPLLVVGLCSWMLIITRGHQSDFHGPGQGLVQQSTPLPSGRSTSNTAGSFLGDGERRADGRMVISMIVLSSATPQGFQNRKLFRETTLKLFPSARNKAVMVNYRFIIGDTSSPDVDREIRQEFKMMGDLLIVSAPDSPDSKSQKLYKAIEWADQFDFDYLVKTEDDVLVRMDILNVPNTHLDDMDLKEMPKFTDGTLTTLSRDIVRLIAIPAPRYFVGNNAQSLGIWLHGYGIQPIHDTRIQPGAFVCEDDLIAKHFDNEQSLQNFARDDPVRMVERINLIRAEIKRNKGNRNYKTSIEICDPLVQKRCAMCYSCQGRASNWKLMGFDCKSGGIVVGDKYRKPELLDAKQMDELLNRPPGGVSDDIEVVPLKDYRPGARSRQQLQSPDDISSGSPSDSPDDAPEDDSVAPEDEPSMGMRTKENSSEEAENEEGDDSDEQQELTTQDEDEALDEAESGQGNPESEDGEGGEGGGEDEESTEQDEDHHDESEMSISDKEVEYLDRRHDEETLPTDLGKKKSSKSKAKR